MGVPLLNVFPDQRSARKKKISRLMADFNKTTSEDMADRESRAAEFEKAHK